MKNIIRVLLISISLALASQTTASPTCINGAQLLEYCTVTLDIYDRNFSAIQSDPEYLQGYKSGICIGYLLSVEELRTSNPCCLPEQFGLLQSATLMVKYLKTHPQELCMPAAQVVKRMYQTYFSCR